MSSGSPPRPRTVMGQWLVAALLGERDRRDRLVGQLPRGKPMRADDAAVVEAAARIALRGYFGADHDVRLVTALASRVCAAQPPAGRPNALDVAAVLRSVLGETEVDLTGITPGQSFKISSLAVTELVKERHWAEPEITALAAQAEATVLREGREPLVAVPT
jgi:hypothetical protein